MAEQIGEDAAEVVGTLGVAGTYPDILAVLADSLFEPPLLGANDAEVQARHLMTGVQA